MCAIVPTDAQILELPPGLKVLICSTHPWPQFQPPASPNGRLSKPLPQKRVETVFSPSGLANLPQSLTNLTIALYQVSSIECLKLLPRTLRRLSLKADDSGIYPAIDHIQDSLEHPYHLLGEYIPGQLSSFELNVDDQRAPYVEWLIQFLKRAKNLTSLWVSHRPPKTSAPPAQEFLNMLPKGLLSLSLTVDESLTKRPDLLHSLPRGLKSLELSAAISYSPPSLTLEHFAKLPSLYQLGFSFIFPVLSSGELFEVIPPGLVMPPLVGRTHSHSPIAIERRERYYSHEIWEGYVPPSD
jgi:hypothetical protein